MDKFVGLAGTGYWGRNILRNLHEMGVLHTACDSNAEALGEFKKKFPGACYTSSFDSMLGNGDIKALALATPAATHYKLAKKALLAGKDVFVEKPLALAVKEGAELVDIAEKENKILMVGHLLYYHPAIKKLQQLLSSGRLGKVYYIYSNRLNTGKIRTEENVLWSFAPHDISAILLLTGLDLMKVKAEGGDYITKGVYDETLVSLEFSGGVRGHVFVNWLNPFKEQKLVVIGSEAMAVFDDTSDEKLFLYPHKIGWIEGKIPVAQKSDCEVVRVECVEPLRQELEHFVECVRVRKVPLTDGREGLRVLRVLEAAQKSLSYNASGSFYGGEKDYFSHETSVIEDGVKIGSGTKIWHFSHILKGSAIGVNCVIGQNVAIGPGVNVGNNCKIQNNVSIYKGVTLEDDVFCGPSCVFTNVYTPRAFIDRKNEFIGTLVKKGSTIGANATIVCGNNIGRYAMVGAGAVVKSDVPDYAIVTGVPAKKIGWACKCGITLKFSGIKAECARCGKNYQLSDDKIAPVPSN